MRVDAAPTSRPCPTPCCTHWLFALEGVAPVLCGVCELALRNRVAAPTTATDRATRNGKA